MAATLAPKTLRQQVEEIHGQHHLGVTGTLELAQILLGEAVSRRLVKVVRQCDSCARICPAVEWKREQAV